MKKALVAVLVVALLASVLAGTFLLGVGRANPGPISFEQLSPGWYGAAPPPSSANIEVMYPKNGTVSKGSSVPLRVSIADLSADVYWITCHLDGLQIDTPLGSPFTINLTDLAEGKHTVEISVSKQNIVDYFWYSGSDNGWVCHTDRAYSVVVCSYAKVDFAVDSSVLQVSVISPVKSASGSTAPLEFSVNESFSKIAYSLDGIENVTVAGNVTLFGLSEGVHTLRVYAWDKYGNVASETVTFTVAKEAFPTTLVIAAVATAAVVSFGLVAYFLRRKRRSGAA
jgi:hypothetical protein